ncbi:LysR substrate-binding domain-containing protein [Plastoroseomonas hellenica]|uniref:LysR substrate-binding domain-containing protein n=1 Tax=Plastoroseomonas hellenica TaxID=2687306 RepID=UPI001BAC934A|nr:LysR substrate-binding domain-containing protein [Plastoroseomonas hellenica]MBR0642275.1 LysR family transcriptional regulator [Plastoroseomonas hellenica]
MPAALPPLPALRAFAAVAREGSFARAAATLNVSTSAVSHQIRTLEDQLGTPLLTRARNGAGHSRTGPTEAGAGLLAAVEEALARLADACDTVRDRAKRPRPLLIVCGNGSLASLWLAPRLAAFASLHPSVAWHMRAVEAEAPDLVAEGIDLAILRARPGAVLPPDRLLFEETVFPVCSPALVATGPEALLRLNLLEEESGSPEKAWRHWLALLGLPPARGRIVRFSGFNQAIGAAIAGAGIALGRSPMVDAELAAGRLVRLFAPVALPGSWVFTLRTRPGLARDPHVAQLRDFLLAAAADRKTLEAPPLLDIPAAGVRP